MHSIPNDAATGPQPRPEVPLARAVAISVSIAALLGAGTAYGGTVDLTHETLHGLRAYFAEAANVRGMFGAALGAFVSVLAARTFAPGRTGDSDER